MRKWVHYLSQAKEFQGDRVSKCRTTVLFHACFPARLETVFKIDLAVADGRLAKQPTMHSVQACC